ncbi:MAG: hypothetical protein HY318_09735 [Armatimonadetes bacterium]|nr:hypothetical protein [Armatimonadota bacterium]
MEKEDTVPQWYWDDLEWASEHSTELHQKYHDVWVAIVDKQVAAAARTIRQARKIASQKTGRRPEDIPVEFIESGIVVYGQN